MPESSINPFAEALHAGLSPIPVDTTTKRPLIPWKRHQETPAEMLQALGWDRHGIGIVCGQVSGRLLCIDIEAGFMDGHGLMELRNRLVGDTYKLVWNWMQGYCESTPSGGIHILVHLEGQGQLAGNTKLASDTDGHTLIETRAEGGYVIVAPSRNGVKGWELMSGGFDSIAYATTEEWAAVEAVLRTFDTSTPTAPPLVVPVSGTPSILRLGDSWVDDELARLPNIRTVLSSLGWEPTNRHDEYGEHWTRPGKDTREGASGSISAADRLYVHSTNAGLPVGNPTLDALDVILATQLGRRATADERVSYLRAQRPPAERGAGAAGQPVADPTVYLDEAFWQSRPYLAAVFAVARDRMISPDAVLGALLSTYAATIPMGIWLPAIVSARAPLNVFSCLVGASGTGKTGSIHAALDLVGPVPNPDICLARSLRSGEGLINLATRPRAKGSDLSAPPTFRNAVQITFDEGAALARQSDRSGSTTIPYLNTAWAGLGVVGGAKAGEQGYFPADLVRICAVMGVQFGAAANLFTGEVAAMGFPQRLLYFGLKNPSLANLDVDEMNSSPIRALDLPSYAVSEFTAHPRYIDVPPEIAREVRLWTQAKDHGAGLDDPLDGHRMNLRLRLAAVLALMEERFCISMPDWDLARSIEACSRNLRSRLLASLGDITTEKAKAAGRNDATRRIEEGNVYLERAALKLARKVQRSEQPLTRKDVRSYLRPDKQRHGVNPQSALEMAESRFWVVIHKDGSVSPGRTSVGGSGGS